MNKRIALATTLALSAGLLIAALAPAHAHHDNAGQAGTTLEMVYKARKDKFVGTVSSAADKCVGGRTVKVYKIRKDGTRKPLGSAKSSSAGVWSVPVADAHGLYGAKVAARSVTLDTGVDEYGNLWVHTLDCSARSTKLKV